MDREGRKRIVEALILSADAPVNAARLADLTPGLTPGKAKDLVEELRGDYEREKRGFEIWEVAGGYQLRTCPDLAPYIRQLHRERALRLSRAAIETLAVVAYKQPVTRAEIEQVRGVDIGAVMRSLVERKLVKIAGHREVPGRPMLYATTRRFLEVFGLENLDDLPTLRQIEELLPPEDPPGRREDSGPAGMDPPATSDAPGEVLAAEELVAALDPAADAEAPPELH